MKQEGGEYQHEFDPKSEKIERLERLCDGKPDALYLLSGISEITSQTPEGEEKKYKPGSYTDVDWKGYMTGGKARALAVVELSEQFPDAIVAVNSNTFNIKDPDAPTDVEVNKEFLERKGVDPERIISQDRSTTTFTELIELIKYIGKNGWQHPVVVAGETQKARTEEMLRQIDTLHDPAGAWQDPEFRAALEKLREIQPIITIVSAEDILPVRDKRYEIIIADARQTETWKIRQKLDENAVNDLRTGQYWKTKK